ncbi:tol-pal system protein YbgF [Aureimonas leprariae]|uniref:tol-pal system protein YbgF n=1 Tax=Plantimonas leprariae TaxID=2615207 RepID=UPI001386D4F5|nr:tol-pal system protein YbgF [Aureimonas leprariae]
MKRKHLGTALRAAAVGALLAGSLSPAAALNLPFGLGAGKERAASERAAEPPVQMAQLGDSGQRISQLEEENRRLNGKVEELSFQVLQMQEQMRKMQEDNDFRFQEIEGGGGGGGGAAAKPPSNAPGKRSEAAPSLDPSATASAGGGAAGPPAAPGEGDQIGSLIGGGEGGGATPTGQAPAAGGAGAAPPRSGTVASIQTKNAGELYGLAYNYLLAGDYGLAESSFRQYAQTYPDAKDVPDARYWLGESQFQQGKYADSAETFLNAQKDYPKSAKAPEMMLKLGMSLVKLDNRDTACVTFKEVTRRYPQMSATVKKKLQTESQAAKC